MKDMNRYEVTVYWKERKPTSHKVLGLNMSQAITVAVRVNCESSSEMYDHQKTEMSVRVIG